MADCKALLLDVAGTTTSIAFVEDVLLRYSNENVESFLNDNFQKFDILQVIDQLRMAAAIERRTDVNVCIVPDDEDSQQSIVASTVKNVQYWTMSKKKLKSLQTLYALVWKNAYESGQVKGHLYPDVKAVLKCLSQKFPIYLYSSANVTAQKFLFTYSIDGDLTPFLSGFFDTSIGLKTESDSYRQIASELSVPPERILFLTDFEREARAARAAGCQVRLVVRDGNDELSDAAKDDFELIHSFTELPRLFNS